MNEPTVDEVEETDVKQYTEGSNVLEKARNAAIGGLVGLVGLAGAACAGNPAPDGGPSNELTTERYEASSEQLGYDISVRITYRGEEDDDIHIPPNCESMDVELDRMPGLRDSDVVSYVEFTDFNCDRDFDRAHFRDRLEESQYYNDTSFRNKLNEDAWTAVAKAVTEGEWE